MALPMAMMMIVIVAVLAVAAVLITDKVSHERFMASITAEPQ